MKNRLSHRLMPRNTAGLKILAVLSILMYALHPVLHAQSVVLKGIIQDEQTLKPIRDVNIKAYGTTAGTSTDEKGNFSLNVNKFPTTVIFTCVGYEVATYTFTETPKKPVEFQLRPKTYLLEGVNISSSRYSYLFKDKDYSVFDYELLGDNLALLTFKSQVKEAELVLLSRGGDTLAFSPLPAVPPVKLLKDFLGNLHYISKEEQAFQFLYNSQKRRIEFYHGITVDSLQSVLRQFIFKISTRLYFQEKRVNGFGTAFGFYEKGTGKKYLRTFVDEHKLTDLSDDQSFYNSWDMYRSMSDNTPKSLMPHEDEFYTTPEFDFGTGEPRGWLFEKNEARAHQLAFYKMIYPVIRTSNDDIAFFNFAKDSIELMNVNGLMIKTVPITFHKKVQGAANTGNSIKLSDSDWRWGNEIMTDVYSREVYTIFVKNGMAKIQRIDMETGRLRIGTVLPFAFPEKIRIYKGDAYFLIKSDGTNDNWKLVRCKI